MKRLVTILAVALAVFSAETVMADLFEGSCLSCKKCDGVCNPKCSTEKFKKHCWDVEAKPVCIPAVKYPWESCCTLKCGRARCVNTLKKHEYEREKNVVKWDASGVVCAQPGCPCGHCNGACGGACSHCQGACGDGCGNGCGTAPQMAPMDGPSVAPPPPPAEKPAPVPPSAKRKLFSIPVVRR